MFKRERSVVGGKAKVKRLSKNCLFCIRSIM